MNVEFLFFAMQSIALVLLLVIILLLVKFNKTNISTNTVSKENTSGKVKVNTSLKQHETINLKGLFKKNGG